MMYLTITITMALVISSQRSQALTCTTFHFRIPPINSLSHVPRYPTSHKMPCPELQWGKGQPCGMYVLSTQTKFEYAFGCLHTLITQLEEAREQDGQLINAPFSVHDSGCNPTLQVSDMVGATLCTSLNESDIVPLVDHLNNYKNATAQDPFSPSTANKTGLRCAVGTFLPPFNGSEMTTMVAQLKPLEKQWQSEIPSKEQLADHPDQPVKCFYKMLETPDSAEVRIEYGVQWASLCPTDECQQYASGDGGICCCDVDDCNHQSLSTVISKIRSASATATGATESSVSTTTEACSGNIAIVAALGATTGILLLIAVVLVVVIVCLRKRKQQRKRTTTPGENRDLEPPLVEDKVVWPNEEDQSVDDFNYDLQQQ